MPNAADKTFITMKYLCQLCGDPLHKNKDSFRGWMWRDMLQAIKAENEGFDYKKSICNPCGLKYQEQCAPPPAKYGYRIDYFCPNAQCEGIDRGNLPHVAKEAGTCPICEQDLARRFHQPRTRAF